MSSSLADALRERYPEDVHSARYTPLQRNFHPHVRLPERLRELPGHVVFRAKTTEHVAHALRLANQLKQPLQVRQGSGQISLDLLTPFPPGSVVLDLRHLDHIEPDLDNGYVDVGPAVTLMGLNDRLRPDGYQFPLAVEPVTWGALLSVNLSGHLVDAEAGKPGDYALGLEVVLPTGEIIHTGTRAMRKVVGPDLTRVFIGGQGLYGVITSARLRLVSAPEGRAWGFAAFDDLFALADTARAIHRPGLPYPVTLEMLDPAFVAASGIDRRLGVSGPLLLVATQGDRQEEADHKLASILAYGRDRHGARTQALATEAEWDALWRIRAMPHEHFEGEYLIGEVMDVPLTRLEDAVEAIQALRTEVLAQFPGMTGYIIGHIGSGTFHPAYSCPADWDYDRRVTVIRFIRERAHALKISFGATIGEQGIFPEHARWFAAHFGETTMRTLDAMRAAFDPNGILNPRRTEPLDAGAGRAQHA